MFCVQWESFKQALHINNKPVKVPKSDVKPPSSRVGVKSSTMDEGSYATNGGAGGGFRSEAFSVLDHSTQTVAEQLTLIEQVRV